MHNEQMNRYRLGVIVPRFCQSLIVAAIITVFEENARAQAPLADQSPSVSEVTNYLLGDTSKLEQSAFASIIVRVLQPYRPAVQFVVLFERGGATLIGSETEDCVDCMMDRASKKGMEALRQEVAKLKATPLRRRTRRLDERVAWDLSDQAAELIAHQLANLNARRDKYRKSGISDISLDSPHYQIEVCMDDDRVRVAFNGPRIDFGPPLPELNAVQGSPLGKFLRRLFALSGLELRPVE